jgi:hypothetical protein
MQNGRKYAVSLQCVSPADPKIDGQGYKRSLHVLHCYIVYKEAKDRSILAFLELFPRMTQSLRKACYPSEKLGSLKRKLHGLG